MAQAAGTYTLLYHAGLPGRAEPIRLLLEATGTPYTDTAKDPQTASQVYSLLGDSAAASGAIPPGSAQPFAPPVLRVAAPGPSGHGAEEDVLISQTANILLYLGEQLGLDGGGGQSGGSSKYVVHGLALTACDLVTEAHDTHHPVSVATYYEDQRAEALQKSVEFREARLPKFLAYFERVLRRNCEVGGGEGRWFVGGQLTYADLVVWQTLDGLKFAFPRELQARADGKEYPLLFDTFYPGISEVKGVKNYLASGRRQPYDKGIFRYYPELDRQ